jgi:hypothetical protein
MIGIGAELDESPVLDRREETAQGLTDPALGDVFLGGHHCSGEGRDARPGRWLILPAFRHAAAAARTARLARSSWRSTVRSEHPVWLAISA